MQKHSAGILLYKLVKNELQVFLVHPGGPKYSRPDTWGIPKGECENEGALDTAMREFKEEVGVSIFDVLDGENFTLFKSLGSITQKGGKVVTAFAAYGNFDSAKLRSNTYEEEYPKGSGKMISFPEVDKGNWFTVEEARRKIIPAQFELIERLIEKLKE